MSNMDNLSSVGWHSALYFISHVHILGCHQKKKKQKDISRQPKGKGRVRIEETYSLDFSAISSDFILLNGHLWYHLLMNGSNINSTISVLLSLFTKTSNVQDYKICRGFRVDSHFSVFKEVIKHPLFLYL